MFNKALKKRVAELEAKVKKLSEVPLVDKGWRDYVGPYYRRPTMPLTEAVEMLLLEAGYVWKPEYKCGGVTKERK